MRLIEFIVLAVIFVGAAYIVIKSTATKQGGSK